MSKQSKVLIIYTGGTIGMAYNTRKNSFAPLNFNYIKRAVPELSKLNLKISFTSFEKPLDSSNFTPSDWIKLANIVEQNYASFDGFVILHGTDTMAYSASALSFMFNNLQKPVIFTGSQLPIGAIRNDARENLITSIEIAATTPTKVPEVSIFFDSQLLRGNRASKTHTGKFDAFTSFNFLPLAEAGIDINYRNESIELNSKENFIVNKHLDTHVGLLKIFPGLTERNLKLMLNPEQFKIIIIETFGSGNAWTGSWFINPIKKAIKDGLIITAITQCRGGSVDLGRYETSRHLLEAGVVDGKDMTTEAAVTKAMHLLGTIKNKKEIQSLMSVSLKGEMTA